MDSEGLRDVFNVGATEAKLNRLSRFGLMQIQPGLERGAAGPESVGRETDR
jgi:hypothetical protein